VLKAILIIVLVIGAVLGGLLTLRNSGRSGMPGNDVLERASKRAREQAAADDKEDR
jgi:hypothetical protein